MFGALLALPLFSISAHAGPRVGDFSLLDQNGTFHHMAWYDDHKAIAFLVQLNGSEQTHAAAADYARMQSRFDADGVEFMMLNPIGESRDSIKQELNTLALQIPVLIDDAQIISEAMGVDKSGEAFLYDPRSFEVIYRGSVAGLEKALEEVVAGQSISSPSVAMSGSDVQYNMVSSAGVSYSRDVAPILADNCATCHREGGIAPFSMDSHAMVQGWSPMIREVLMTKRMPPGQIDPHVGKFSNDYVLAVEEQQKIVQWIEAGAQKDGDIDPLAELTWPATKWALGEPDLIVKVPPQSIPATGILDYITVEVPIDIDRDRWVRASQYIPGDRTVLHHTLNDLVPPGATGRRGFLGGGDPNQANITAYIPGAEPAIEPPNTGGLLQAGSTLRLQLHYTTTGKETVDASEIGVWFYPDDEIPTERMSGQCACIFPMGWTNITPFDPNFELRQSVTLKEDAYMQSFLPHMHFRGKSMRFNAHYPDGSEQELINIANYNYNWQISYKLEEPILMPAGTRIEAIGHYDNSTQNKANPDPSRSVPWGDQSWDEMFFGAMSWKNVDQSRSGGGQ
tara:strand:- start:23402 stop:25099 length:1698 start_codon:yes stop_codon:yes gene_type:complete